jgi:hypothetical protein
MWHRKMRATYNMQLSVLRKIAMDTSNCEASPSCLAFRINSEKCEKARKEKVGSQLGRTSNVTGP